MLSGITRWVAPLNSGTPSICSTSVPMPWIRAPIFPRNIARSTTWGSRAALWMVVMPSAGGAALLRVFLPAPGRMSGGGGGPVRPALRAAVPDRGPFLVPPLSPRQRAGGQHRKHAILGPADGHPPAHPGPPLDKELRHCPPRVTVRAVRGPELRLSDLGSLDPPAAAEFRQPQPGFGPGQGGRRGGLVGVGKLLLQQALGTAARFLGAGFVDVVGPLGGVGQDRDLVGAHLEESARNEKELLLAVVADLHGAGCQRGQQRDVPRQDAKLAPRAGRDHEIGIAFEAPPLDGDDVDVELIGHALFGPLAVLCAGLRFLLLRLVALRLLSLRLLAPRLAILRLLRLWFRVLLAAALTFRRLDGFVDGAHHVKGLLGEVVVFAVEDFTEAADRLLQRHVFPGPGGEHLA